MNQTGELTFDIEQFSSHSAELDRLLTDFSDLLDKETDAIKKNLPEELIKTINQKEELANLLTAANQNIDDFLGAKSLNLSSLTETDLFSTLPKTLQQQTLSLLQKIQVCHDKNLANGMSIQMLSNINQFALDMISGKPKQDVNLYGSSGEKTRSSGLSTLGKA